MSTHDRDAVHERELHGSTRRRLLCGMGAIGAMVSLSPIVAGSARGQSAPQEMPDSITTAANRLRDRQLSVTELTKAYLKQAKELQPKLNAFITFSESEALASAALLDSELSRGQRRGPLHGIPVVYKDNFDTAGVRTTMGSEFYSKRIAQSDAEAVRKLNAAGTVMLGKMNMNEFAAGVAGRNKFFGRCGRPLGHEPLAGRLLEWHGRRRRGGALPGRARDGYRRVSPRARQLARPRGRAPLVRARERQGNVSAGVHLFQERLMFRVAAAYTRATEFHKQRPAIYANAKLAS